MVRQKCSGIRRSYLPVGIISKNNYTVTNIFHDFMTIISLAICN